MKPYEEVLAAARSNICLRNIGDDRKCQNSTHHILGGLLVEVPGKESAARADDLAERLKKIFSENGEVKISRLVKRSELRISGLDISVKTVEVAAAVAAEGGYSVGEVKTGEIKKRSPRGMGSVWVQCPTTAAKKVAGKSKITIGWVVARVEALAACPMICFRCMERGHTARNCTSTKDRSNCYYNCGEKGHQAKVCAASPRCPICADLGLPASYRLGARRATPPPPNYPEKSRERDRAGSV